MRRYRVAETPAPCRKPAGLYVLGPADVYALSVRMTRHRQEVFRVLLLDGRHRLLRNVIASIGTIDAALVHPRDVFREAIRRNAAAVVLVHNHPSGDPTPSRDDIELTRRLVGAGKLLGIGVLDHLVVAKGGYVSLREYRPPHGYCDNPFEGGDECSTRAASTPSGT